MKVLPIGKLTGDDDNTWIVVSNTELHDLRECVRLANLFIDDRFRAATGTILDRLSPDLRSEWKTSHTHDRAKLLREISQLEGTHEPSK